MNASSAAVEQQAVASQAGIRWYELELDCPNVGLPTAHDVMAASRGSVMSTRRYHQCCAERGRLSGSRRHSMTELNQTRSRQASGSASGSFIERWRPVASRFLVPLLAAGLFALAIWTIHHSIAAVCFSQIRREIVAIPGSVLWLACGLTASSFLALAFQDYVALWSTGKKIPFIRAALGSYIAQSVAHSTGFSILIGGALRCRYYMSEGLSFADTMKVQLSFSGTFGMATCILLGLSFLLDPSLAAAQTAWLPEVLVRSIGVVLLLGPLGVFVWRAVHVGPLRLLRRQIDMPDTRHLLPQTLLSLTDVSCMGAVLYVFLPPELHISYPALIGFFAIAMTIGVTSHVPGGLGVFEAAILLLVAPAEPLKPALLSALVMFRFVYYFLPLVLGGVAVAVTEGLRHRRRLQALSETMAQAGSSVVPMVFAMLAFMAGTILLASSALPGTGWRINLVNAYLTQGVLELAHFLSAVAGTLLLLLGRPLSRRLSEAWWVTQTLLVISGLLALAKGLEYEVAALCGLLFVALLPCKAQFYRSGRLIDQRLTPIWMMGITAVVVFMCWLLAFVYRHLDYSQTALLQFDLQRHASRSFRATVAMLTTLSVVLIWQGLRATQRQVAVPGDSDPRRLRRVVAQSASSRAHLALTGDKSLLWHGTIDAFQMYGVSGRSWIGIGDPVGPSSAHSDLVWDLRDLADRHGGNVVFADIDGDALPVYLDLGLQAATLGTRLSVSLDQLDMERWRQLFDDLPHGQIPSVAPADGLAFEICRDAAVDGIMSDVARLSDDWREAQQLREQRVIKGWFSRDYVAQCPVAVLRHQGRIVAFAVLWCGAEHAELAIDLFRWAPAAAADIPQRFLAAILIWAKRDGYRRLSLGLQPGLEGTDAKLAALWQEAAGGLEGPEAQSQRPVISVAALLRQLEPQLTFSADTAYLLYPMGRLPQSLRDLIDLINLGRPAI
jgi:phosphatidylglycerol lysyltransferase